jgi:hypothetical protein
MQTLNLSNYGLMPMSIKEATLVNGGGDIFTDWIIGHILDAAADALVALAKAEADRQVAMKKYYGAQTDHL